MPMWFPITLLRSIFRVYWDEVKDTFIPYNPMVTLIYRSTNEI